MESTFIIGGARSGKSSFAEKIAKNRYKDVTYIATATATDEDMKERIRLHKNSRPSHWNTIEKYKNFNTLINDENFINAEIILFDCITLMITNMMIDSEINFDNANSKDISKLESLIVNNVDGFLYVCKNYSKDIIIVSNETGLGLVPSYFMGNYFRDIAGRVNKKISEKVDNVFFMVAGIPIQIKKEGKNITWGEDF